MKIASSPLPIEPGRAAEWHSREDHEYSKIEHQEWCVAESRAPVFRE